MPNIMTFASASATGFGENLKSKNSGHVGPTGIGEPFQGGYYAGRIRNNAGEWWLVMSPKVQGERTNVNSNPGSQNTNLATQLNDGFLNCQSLANGVIAAFLSTLNINGFTDWYIPSRDEAQLIYQNLKPTTAASILGNRDNVVSVMGWGGAQGYNPSSVPTSPGYATNAPSQTTAPLFQVGGSEAFDLTTVYDANWTSTQSGTTCAIQRYINGDQDAVNNQGGLKYRVIRRVQVV